MCESVHGRLHEGDVEERVRPLVGLSHHRSQFGVDRHCLQCTYARCKKKNRPEELHLLREVREVGDDMIRHGEA